MELAYNGVLVSLFECGEFWGKTLFLSKTGKLSRTGAKNPLKLVLKGTFWMDSSLHSE
jgi:hypothetical protein